MPQQPQQQLSSFIDLAKKNLRDQKLKRKQEISRLTSYIPDTQPMAVVDQSLGFHSSFSDIR